MSILLWNFRAHRLFSGALRDVAFSDEQVAAAAGVRPQPLGGLYGLSRASRLRPPLVAFLSFSIFWGQEKI